MSRARLFLVALAALWLLSIPVAADWVDADGHKMHFPQHPNPFGWDVNATQIFIADDWMCGETGPVSDIHFWGSWRDNVVGPIMGFHLMILSDIPADPPQIPYSRPGQPLWEQFIPIEQVVIRPMPLSPQGWYSPMEQIFIPENHVEWFQYNIFLPQSLWFMQEQGTIYWLAIKAEIPIIDAAWGWKTTLERWNDDACWTFEPGAEWIEMYEPPDFLQSLNLAFVITGRAQPVGACCYSPTGGPGEMCIVTDQLTCINQYAGSYQGDGTVCGGMEACCLPDGTCLNADALCCVNEMGGMPQGPGTVCTQWEACCMPDGICLNMDPLCCAALGGVPLGQGTVCTAPEACCLPDGNCLNLDPLCCMAYSPGASPQGPGTVCTQPRACCLNDGTGGCLMVDPLCCDDMGGTVSTTSMICLGDNNGNGLDDACEKKPWEPGDPHKMHYPQLPDPLGWDVNATMPMILADDWQCSSTGPITDFHFWGSWQNNIVGNIGAFLIRIYTDIPAAPPQIPYSRPGELVWEMIVPFEQVLVVEMEPSMQGWYDPMQQLVMPGNHVRYFQYNIFLPPEIMPFRQVRGEIYWLAISAFVSSTIDTQWGWKSSLDHFNDDAVWSTEMMPVEWIELYYPPDFTRSLDLAFVVTGESECDCVPGDANNDTVFNLLDILYIIDYVYGSPPGPAPVPYPICSGDPNCDCVVNLIDILYLIAYKYNTPPGDAPCSCDDWVNSCGLPLRK